MFEKEAIRHAFEDTIGVECLIKPVEDFTYEELSDEQQEKAYDFKKGAEFGYNKANEWHYVKDGDLPKEDDVYLVYTTKGVLLGHYEQGGADGETNFKGEPYSDFTEYPSEMLFTENEIIAWKEIVLPELKESE